MRASTREAVLAAAAELGYVPNVSARSLADGRTGALGLYSYDYLLDEDPVMAAHRATTPCLNIAGALDRCTPPTQAQEFHQALLEHGVESQLVIYPQEGHGVRAFPALVDFCSRVVDWFSTHMPARVETRP